MSRCRAWERGAKARLVSVAAAARYGASEALLSVIMVFCRLVCSFSASVQGGRKERRRAHTGGTAERDGGRRPIKVETWFRFSIPSSHSGFLVYAVRSPSPVYSFALSSPDYDVAVFLSPLSRPRDNDPELSKHHRRTLMEIESSRATRPSTRHNASFRSVRDLNGAVVEDRFSV